MMNKNSDFINHYNEINHQLEISLNSNWERVNSNKSFLYDIPFVYFKHKTKDLVLYYDMGLVWKQIEKNSLEKGCWVKGKKKTDLPNFIVHKDNHFDYNGSWKVDFSMFYQNRKTIKGIIQYCNRL